MISAFSCMLENAEFVIVFFKVSEKQVDKIYKFKYLYIFRTISDCKLYIVA